MNKPWIGYLATGFLFVAGILECLGGNIWLGVLFMVLSIISLCLRIYFNKKIKESQSQDKK